MKQWSGSAKDNLPHWKNWKRKCKHGKSQRRVVIENEAKLQLRKTYNYIKRDSLQNAEKVRSKILASIKELIKNAKRHPADKYRVHKDISYRAYEIYKYRITYQFSNTQRVIRVRHSKMNPLEY
ncbi:type II toxin-antitoxin system RelE/ParE family toxin [Terrimonas alba]|uniref:type II toxin-antitoxin system RelE/ParE family toxin n=1 Tax=Terrimonas alba TaxID=3349636 RepID=UPI0035F29FFF